MKKIKVGSDFSGVGAFDQALIRLGVDYKKVFACDMDKYARQTYLLNFAEPEYFPKDVYEREIPKESLDIFMTSPPCQAFSMAGKRLGKEDKRGILFFNSLEFIQENKPRYFIFENVKGLLSHDKTDKKKEYGNTFQEWINYLGGKSVNGVHTFFPYEDAVPYHIYFQVLNAKDYNIPQNRERIFIIGIRDDEDNDFQFPKSIPLTKRLKDVLEPEVDEKYFLSENTLNYFKKHLDHHQEKGNGFGFKPQELDDTHANSLTTKYGSRQSDTYLKISTNNSKGFDEAEEEGSINFSVPNSKTRRGRVGKKVSQTLDTQCNQGIVTKQLSKQETEMIKIQYGKHQQDCFYDSNGIIGTIPAGTHGNTAHFTQTLMPCKQRIRRLTPTECFRLMDFNENFIEKTINSKLISDSQLYKQAGNSICVGVLALLISKLKL